jgi:hypothetical protein
MDKLFQSQPSFGKFSVEAAHSIIDRYLIEGMEFGTLLSLRNVDIVWQMLTLPSPFLHKLILRKLKLAFTANT